VISGYGQLFRLEGARGAEIPAASARLAGTMVSLALLLTLADSGHSLAAAGTVSAAYAVGTAAGFPVAGRLMERLAPTPVLRTTGILVTIFLVTAALSADRAPAGVLASVAFGAGLTTAPVGASMRALWSRLTSDPGLRQRAYAFEATFSELLFIAGPAAVTLLISLVGAPSALISTAVLLGAGAFGYGQCRLVRQQRPVPRRSPGGATPGGRAPSAATHRRRRGAATVPVLTAIASTAALSSAAAVATTAMLRAQGSSTALAGGLMALQSVGSVAGGIRYGRRHRDGTSLSRYVRLLAVLTATLAMLPTVYAAHLWGMSARGVLVLLAGLMILSGTPIAPAGAEEFQLIGDMTVQERMTQAFAGVGSVIAIGGAAGSAAAGFTAVRLGPAAALALPAAFTLVALVLVVTARGAIIAATSETLDPLSVSTTSSTPDVLGSSSEGPAT
jgi:hypothetical protein